MESQSPFDPLPDEPSEMMRHPTSPFAHDPEPRLVLTMLPLAILFERWLAFQIPGWIWRCMWFSMPCVLAYAVVGDKRLGQRRPWTLWLGIALQAWLWFTDWILPLLFPLG